VLDRVLRKIFEPKREEVTGKLRKLHYEELNLYCSPNIVRVTKSRRMRYIRGHEPPGPIEEEEELHN
jgi:hypothetical protein